MGSIGSGTPNATQGMEGILGSARGEGVMYHAPLLKADPPLFLDDLFLDEHARGITVQNTSDTAFFRR